MIQFNPRYEALFDTCVFDEDCDEIAGLMNVEGDFIKDEHWCYFDDMYSPEYTMQWLYETIQKYDIDAVAQALLEEGHNEILQSECYEDSGYPS